VPQYCGLNKYYHKFVALSSTFVQKGKIMLLPRIKELREAAGLSQKKMAEILELHRTQYQRYETGESPVTIDFLMKLADFYGVSLDYIAGRTDEHTTESENIG
jgi:transcriptional regulator with XRE-family HTH domain